METVATATLFGMPAARQLPEPSHDEVRSRLRAWVRYFMDDNGWDQQAFAEAINTSRPTITNILNDKRPMGLKTFVKMHFHLGAQYGVTMEKLAYSSPPVVGAARAATKARNQA